MVKIKSNFNCRVELSTSDFFILMGLGVALIILQGSLIARIGYRGYGPEMALILTFYSAIKTNLERSSILAVALGFIRDGVGGGFLGLYPATLLAVAVATFYLKQNFDLSGPRQIIPTVFIFSMGSGLLITGPLLSIMSKPMSAGLISFDSPAKAFLISCVITSLMAWLLFPLLNSFFKRRAIRRDSEN